MRNSYTRFYALVLLTFGTLTFLPNTFAQGPLAQPSVRLVYFLPNDRPARPERVKALRQLIKDAQQFYADEMQRHGYGTKTFRVETDRHGEPIVHRFNGRGNEHYYYQRLTDFKVWEEFFQQVNDFQHVYFIAIDLSHELLNEGESCGLGGGVFFPANTDAPVFSFGTAAVRHRDETPREEVLGGSAIIPASGPCFEDNRGYLHNLRVTTHELAHAFGLEHDFRNPDSAVGGRGFQFSQCDMEWLSVSRFFTSKSVSKNASGNIQLISRPTYSPEGITLRFEVTDADGLHQAQLLVPEDGSWGPWKLIGCQELDGHTQRIEFVTAELAAAPVERVLLQFMDDLGNITWATTQVDIASVLPRPKVVSIPDRNLAAAVRKTLGLTSNAQITDQAMQKLTRLEARESQIKDLTGLEHATQLTELRLYKNQIRDVNRLSRLTLLKFLDLDQNQIRNIRPLTGLTQLEGLYIGGNEINNQGIQILTNLTELRWLSLYGNKIGNIKPLANLTKLKGLWLEENKIRDVSPLAGLLNLEVLKLKGNLIKDFSPLANLPKLRDVDVKIPDQGAPSTGTWLFIHKPPNLTPDTFTIGPGEFAILVHQGKQNTIKKADFKTYASYYAHDDNTDFPNLAQFFQNGGRIELVSHASINPLPSNTREPQFGDIVISEIMWGLNGYSLAKQYIELYNASAHTYTFSEGNLSLRFSKASEAALPDTIFPFPPNPNAHTKVVDRLSNKGWKVPGKSGNIQKKKPLISMYRMINYTTGVVPDGTVRKSWKASKGRVNLPAPSYGTPGAKHTSPDADIAAAPVNTAVASSQTALPDATNLLANYPNPFNPETWIPYQLAKASDVKITIYDARGVVIRRIELGHQTQGFYTSRTRAAYWDGRNNQGERVASGVYFYQLQTDNVSSLRKMLILK